MSSLPSDQQSSAAAQDASGRQPSAATTPSAQLASAINTIRPHLRSYSDFPIPGIEFVDIMPLFADPRVYANLIAALDLQVRAQCGDAMPEVIVGLDARGFLFGPGLAQSLGVGFAAVRKKGKLPGPCYTAEYVKEYGSDFFQMQKDAVKEGQKVLIVDDIIATGGSAAAAADLVKQCKGDVIGFQFILEIKGLDGQAKLGGLPTSVLL